MTTITGCKAEKVEKKMGALDAKVTADIAEKVSADLKEALGADKIRKVTVSVNKTTDYENSGEKTVVVWIDHSADQTAVTTAANNAFVKLFGADIFE